MDKFIRVEEINKNLKSINLAITLKSVDGKSKDDMKTVCKEANFNFENLTSNIQTHSDKVNIITKSNVGVKTEGDALVTNLLNTPLLIFTADCVPIAIIDDKNKAIGLAHAGWKGTYSKIVKNTIDVMVKNYNTNPKDLVCVIGPSIGSCCYEVSKELVEKFNTIITNEKEKFYIIKEDRYYLDLWNINKQILKESNVDEKNIINLNICTSCECDKFHSYRKHNKTDERIATILEIK